MEITDNQLKNIYNQGWDNCSAGIESREAEFSNLMERFAYTLGYVDYKHDNWHPSTIHFGWDEKIKRIRKVENTK